MKDEDLDDDIPKILREKYEQIEVPRKMFDMSKLDESMIRKNKMKRISIAALYVIVFISIGTIISFMLKESISSKDSNENIQAKIEENNKKDEKEIYILGGVYGSKWNVSVVSLLKVDEILESQFIDDVPYTKIKVTVQENFLGELKEEYIYVPGGRFKVDDVKGKLDKYNLTNLDFKELDEYNNLYINFNTGISISRPTVGEEYLVSLENRDGKLYASLNMKYGFKKYNKETNCVITDEGKEIPVDLEEYLKNK